MIPSEVYALGATGNPIREIADYAMARAGIVGAENVYDFSIGSPSVAPPPSVQAEALRLLRDVPATQLHAYSPDQGLPEVRKAVADYLNGAFSMTYAPEDIYMTSGASAALAIVCRALLSPGDECITLTPYFSEYRTYTEAAGGVMREVPSEPDTFQLDYAAFAAAVNEKTWLVILNSPNNPSGVVLGENSLRKIAALLTERSERYGHPIYILADEPYRDLVYDGDAVPYIPSLYTDTLYCYSFSKSLSLPGERVGYIAVPPESRERIALRAAVSGAGRMLGYVCAPVFFQRVCAAALGQTGELREYKKNRDLIYEGLTSLGFSCAKPQGAFYLFIKTPEDDRAFCKKAMTHDILLVPGDDFACPGYARLAYCVPEERLRRSLGAFAALAAEYGLKAE